MEPLMSSESHLESVSITKTQSEIAQVWASILAHQDGFLDPDASFTDLGGESLAAWLCMNRLRDIFGPQLDVDLSDFFHPQSTVRNFAMAIYKSRSTNVEVYR